MRKAFLPLLTLAIMATGANAQIVTPRDVGAAVILNRSDAARRPEPYASPGQGSIASAAAARDACTGKALYQAGAGARLIGSAHASSMSTGWEVEGVITVAGQDVPFVCSVRNGSVSGVLLRR